jgi:hypothetical protein
MTKWKLSVWVRWVLIQRVINRCDRWWEKLLSCGRGEECWSYPDNELNLLLYKGFTLEITNKWWPLTTLNRWPLYPIKIYSKMHRESTKVTVMSRWPLYKGDRYDRFDCVYTRGLLEIFIHYDESRNSLTKIILYLVHHVKIINICK